MRHVIRLIGSLASLTFLAGPAAADAVRMATVGCRDPAAAGKIAVLLNKRDKGGASALAGPLVASGACMNLVKGIAVSIDERRGPLACVRLTGDLSCYWVAAVLVDEHPGQKGGEGRPGGRGGRRH